MNKFVKVLLLSITVIVCAICSVACAVKPSTSNRQSSYKKIGDHMTFCEYVATDNETTFDLGEYAEENNIVITRIKAGAFEGNENLTEVIIPSTVTRIDAGAFAKMKNLEKLTIPFVGGFVDADSYYLETGSTDKAIDTERLFGYIFGKEEYNYGVTITQNYNSNDTQTYYIPWKLKTVVIQPASTYKVPMYAFNGNKVVQNIVLSDNVNTIGDHAFENCISLKTITIPSAVEKINDSAFKGCFSLSEITIPSAVKEICDYAFSGCSKLESVTFGSSTLLSTIGQYAFEDTKISTIVLPNGVTRIEEGTFQNCKSLKTVKAPNVIYVGMIAFEGCTSFDSYNTNSAKTISLTNTTVSYRSFADLMLNQTYMVVGYTGSLDLNLVGSTGQLKV